MRFSIFECAKYDKHWWVSLVGIEIGDGEMYLFHVERDMGVWKFDILFLRKLIHRIRYRACEGDEKRKYVTAVGNRTRK